MKDLLTNMSARKRMPSYRPWGSTEDGNIEFESLTNDTLEGALRVIRESFFPHENVCKAVNITSDQNAMKDLEDLCIDMARDGVSVVAVDVNNNDVVGVVFNKIQTLCGPTEKSYFDSFAEECKGEAAKVLIDFMNNIDNRVNVFKHYNVECILEAVFLATLPSYGQRRIGELLISSTLEIGHELKRGKKVRTPVEVNGDNTIQNANSTPTLVSAIMTSKYSQKIAAKLGFDKALEVSFDEFHRDGRQFSSVIGPEHPSSILVAKRLT